MAREADASYGITDFTEHDVEPVLSVQRGDLDPVGALLEDLSELQLVDARGLVRVRLRKVCDVQASLEDTVEELGQDVGEGS